MTAGLRGAHWEDFEVGDVHLSSGRTVSESDISSFAALSGDFNPLHMDAEFGRASAFGERVPHGPLGLLIAMGGYDRLGLLEGTAVAFLGLTWTFIAPLRVGDTVRTRVRVTGREETRHPDRGGVALHVQLLNQHDDVVQEGTHRFVVLRRPAGEQ